MLRRWLFRASSACPLAKRCPRLRLFPLWEMTPLASEHSSWNHTQAAGWQEKKWLWTTGFREPDVWSKTHLVLWPRDGESSCEQCNSRQWRCTPLLKLVCAFTTSSVSEIQPSRTIKSMVKMLHTTSSLVPGDKMPTCLTCISHRQETETQFWPKGKETICEIISTAPKEVCHGRIWWLSNKVALKHYWWRLSKLWFQRPLY